MSPFRITLVFVLVALAGIFCAPFLSLSFSPAPSANAFTVSYSFAGMPPLTVEREVTAPIENELSRIQGLKSVSSVSRHGSGYVQVEFDAGEDMAFRQQELYMAMRQLKLPPEVGRPVIRRQSQNEKAHDPLLIYEMRFDITRKAEVEQALYGLIVPRLASVQGVSEVGISGLDMQGVRVAYLPERLNAYGLTPGQVRQRVAEHTADQSLALVWQHGRTYSLNVRNQVNSLEELASVPMSEHLTLGHLAQVAWHTPPVNRKLRVNGQEAVFVTIYASHDANRLQLAARVRDLALDLSRSLPSGLGLSLATDDTTYLADELRKAGIRSALCFLLVALFGLIGYRNWRYVILLSSSLLVNLGLIGLVAYLARIEIHLYTLAGLAISFGLVVDNSIVSIDSAGKRGKRRILVAQLAASATTMAALVVVLFLPREFRQDLTELVVIVCVALATSFLVSWWYIPAMASQLHLGTLSNRTFRKKRLLSRIKGIYAWWLETLPKRRLWAIFLMIWAFGLPVYLLPTKVNGWEWYNHTLGSEFYLEKVRPHVDKWLGGSSRVFYRNVYERSQYRTPEKTRLYVYARLPYGHTVEQMDQTIRKVEAYLNEFPEIHRFVTTVQSGQRAGITIEFTPESEHGDFPFILKNKLTNRSLDWGGVEWSIYGVGRGFSNASGDQLPSFQITLKGYDYDRLGTIADSLKARLLVHPRIQSVNTDARASWNDQTFERLTFAPKANRANEYLNGVEQLRTISGQPNPVGQIKLRERLYPLFLDAWQGEQLPLYHASYWSSNLNPLISTGELTFEKVTNAIYREERQYVRTVRFDYFGSYRFGDAFLDETLSKVVPTLPLGYSAEKAQWTWDKRQEKKRYAMLAIAALLILLVGIVYTESIAQSLKILVVIPCSYIGLFLAFGWGGFSFDQGGYAAFLFLTGLSVNALLFILSDHYTFIQRKDAWIKALTVKFWPVTLTVLSTVVGFIPFLMFGEGEVFWYSLAVGTIGGLLISYLITFLLLPAFFIKTDIKRRATNTYK
jgi:multidrug efflux pump subunit AcrB